MRDDHLALTITSLDDLPAIRRRAVGALERGTTVTVFASSEGGKSRVFRALPQPKGFLVAGSLRGIDCHSASEAVHRGLAGLDAVWSEFSHGRSAAV